MMKTPNATAMNQIYPTYRTARQSGNAEAYSTRGNYDISIGFYPVCTLLRFLTAVVFILSAPD